jgi:hypothetical protein
MKKCQVLLQSCERLEYYYCKKSAIALIKDIVCDCLNNPFYVCKKHCKEFLKGNHYKLIKKLKEA